MSVNRCKPVSEEAGEMLAGVRLERIGSTEQFSFVTRLDLTTIQDIEQGRKPVFRETLRRYLKGLDWPVDPKELEPGKVPSVREVLSRYPTSVTANRVIEQFLANPLCCHDIIDLIHNHRTRVLTCGFDTCKDIATSLLKPARSYSEGGHYLDAFRTFRAAASLFASCSRSNDELACLTQCLFMAWTRAEPEIVAKVPAIFKQATRVVEAPREDLKPTYVANYVACLARGAFHDLLSSTGELNQVALQLFAMGDYKAESADWPLVVDPQLVIRRN